MALKVYISGMSGNKEVKKRQQRVLMILDSKNIKYDIIDITEPGKESEKELMQTKSTSNGATVSDPEPRHPLPPQIFNDDEYCGDYDAFDLANEIDTLEQFLKLAPADTTSVSSAQIELKKTPSQDQNGDATSSNETGNEENKENLQQETKTSDDAVDVAGKGEKKAENGDDAVNQTETQQADENAAASAAENDTNNKGDTDRKNSNDEDAVEKPKDDADDQTVTSKDDSVEKTKDNGESSLNETENTESTDKIDETAEKDSENVTPTKSSESTEKIKENADDESMKKENENVVESTESTMLGENQSTEVERDAEDVKPQPVLESTDKTDEKQTEEGDKSKENTNKEETIEKQEIEESKELEPSRQEDTIEAETASNGENKEKFEQKSAGNEVNPSTETSESTKNPEEETNTKNSDKQKDNENDTAESVEDKQE